MGAHLGEGGLVAARKLAEERALEVVFDAPLEQVVVKSSSGDLVKDRDRALKAAKLRAQVGHLRG